MNIKKSFFTITVLMISSNLAYALKMGSPEIEDNFSNNTNSSVIISPSLFTFNTGSPQVDSQPEMNVEESIKLTRKGYFEYAQNNMHSTAISFYKHALDEYDKNASTHHALGHSLSEMGQYDEAEKAYLRALVLRPDHGRTLAHLGLNFERKENYDQALLHYAKSLEIEPNYNFTLPRYKRLMHVLSRSASKENVYQVNVKTTLSLKTYPFYHSARITKLSPKDKVILIRRIGNNIETEGKFGKWALVKSGNTIGFVFDAYIVKAPSKPKVQITKVTKGSNKTSPQQGTKKLAPVVAETLRVSSGVKQTKKISPQTTKGRNFTIQLASFDNIDNANQTKLQFSKYGAFVFKDRKNGRNIVAVGRYGSSEEARKHIGLLKTKIKKPQAQFFPKDLSN